jgi:rRNA small subunit pseudouridine methyltransferase Nep1
LRESGAIQQCLTSVPDAIIIEGASLELVPKAYWKHESCKLVEERFGALPPSQILDDNYHHKIIEKLPSSQKRGRPDIVHFALLDIISTPAYLTNQIRVIVHTLNDQTIRMKEGVRLPRTQERFNGVMAKLLSNKLGQSERNLFEFDEKQTFKEILETLGRVRVVSLTREGIPTSLRSFAKELRSQDSRRIAWVIGGFARGHFDEDVKSLSDDMISISEFQLASHVVVARVCYEMELSTV